MMTEDLKKSDTTTVTSFLLNPITEGKFSYIRDFDLNNLNKEKELKSTKLLYDKPYSLDSHKFYNITKHFDIASKFRNEISNMYNTPNVSNAWLKCYEMIMHYNLIPTIASNFTHFDNAAFPGAFILAVWHYAHTFSDIKNYTWRASSLLPNSNTDMKSNGPLHDKYQLYKNYPNNWTMTNTNNGDVTLASNQRDWAKRFANSVDLYTSDLGFDVSNDYNNQELQHAHANIGQICTGLQVLKPKGAMIIKQFTYFLPFTVSVLGALTTLFEKVEICKPMFSRPVNSETYIVCLNYKPDKKKELINKILDRLDKFSLKPFITKSCMGDAFLDSIYKSQTYFADIQIDEIKKTISEFNRFARMKNVTHTVIKTNNSFAKNNAKKLKLWESVNTMIKLKDSKKL